MVFHCFALLIENEDEDILRQMQGSGIRDSIPCPERLRTFDLNTKHMFVMKVIIAL